MAKDSRKREFFLFARESFGLLIVSELLVPQELPFSVLSLSCTDHATGDGLTPPIFILKSW